MPAIFDVSPRALLAGFCVVSFGGCVSYTDQESVTQAAAVQESSSYLQARDTLYSAETRFDYPAAIDGLAVVVSEDPANAAARLDLVYAMTKLARFDDAMEHLVAAHSLKGQLSPGMRLWLDALAARVDGQPNAEIDRWREVVVAMPDDRWAWYELASSLSGQERYAEAANAAAEAVALERDPKKWSASWLYYLHSKALYRSGQFEAGIRAAEPGRETPVIWRPTFYRLALSQAAADSTADREAMMDKYRRIAVEEGRTPPFYLELNVGLFYFELGDYQRSADLARKSLKMSDSGYGRYVLAYSLTELGRADEALEMVASGAEKYPDHQLLAASHGWTLYRLGKLDAARAELLRARTLSDRPNYRVEHDLAVVEKALADPSAPSAPKIAWLG